MKEMIDKQQIAQLLSKFMDGETNVAEEQTLAQYFHTNEVDDEWLEFKEMFALFDDGKVDIDADSDTSSNLQKADSDKLPQQPKAVREKPKIVALRWLVAGIAACFALLVVFHFSQSSEHTPLSAQNTEAPTPNVQTKPEVISPNTVTEQPIVAQDEPAKPAVQPTTAKRQNHQPKVVAQEVPKATEAESLADCIARLEAEMDGLDDSVSADQVERLIAADVRLQQMVNRIVGKQVEQAMNEIQNDSTLNYVAF